MASGGYWLCFTNVKVFFPKTMWSRTKFLSFRSKYDKSFYFSSDFCVKCSFSAPFIYKSRLEHLFCLIYFCIYIVCVFLRQQIELRLINLFLPLS